MDPTETERVVAERRRKKFVYAAQAMRQSGQLKQGGLKDSRFLGWLTNSEVWWRHPVCRIAVTWIILAEDFYIYGEDPVNDSHVGANYFGMGNILGLYAIWATPTAGEAILKLILIAMAVAGAILIGRQLLVKKLLRQRWQINAFYGGEGCLFVVFVTFGFTSLVATYMYNFIATDQLDGHSMEIFLILGAESLQYRHVGKCFQVLSASIDFLTIVMITDAVMQDRIHHQFWAARLKHWYICGLGGYARVISCWSVFLGGASVAAGLVFGTGSGEESGIRWTDTTIGGTTELGRSFLASCIVFTDLVTVLQDWDFPMFREPLAVDVPVLIAGTTATQLRCDLFGSLVKRLPRLPDKILARLPPADAFAIHITGKWLTYGPLLGVMGVDFMCAKTQMLYDPIYYGQYVNPTDHHVWMIVDQDYLSLAYDRGNVVNATLITWEARHNLTTGDPLDESAATDVRLNSRYSNEPGTRYLALLLSLGMLVGFCWLLWAADWRRAAEIDRIAREDEDIAKNQIVGQSSPCDPAAEDPETASATQPPVPDAPLPPPETTDPPMPFTSPEADEMDGRRDPPTRCDEAVLGPIPELLVGRDALGVSPRGPSTQVATPQQGAADTSPSERKIGHI